jgi:NADH-quinone oxidoreductase subunit N
MNSAPEIHLSVLAPLLVVAVAAMLVLMLEVFLSRARSFLGRPMTESLVGVVTGGVSCFALFVALLVAGLYFAGGGSRLFDPAHPLFQLDPYSALVTAMLALAAMLSCALAIAYLDTLRINHGEFYALLLLSVAGMMFMVGAVDLIAVFLGLETMSIPLYVLAGFDRRKLHSNESALKYFLIGSFASAVLVYGMALLYGATGSTSFEGIRAGFDAQSPLALIGLGLVIVGFGFKISSVPFHQWTPDVYEGAPAVVTAFMSVTVKTAAVAALLRLVAMALGPVEALLQDVLWWLAAATVVVGNAMAVIQSNVKRLLAYSSVAHAGYILIGFVAGGPEGYSAVLFYLIVYTLMNLGAFGVVVALAQQGQDCEKLESLAGLARSRPALAALMTLFLVSLTGIPGTAGFIGKFVVFMAAVRAGEIPLMILGVLMSVVSVYYYLRIPVLMYMREPTGEGVRMDLSSGEAVVLAFCAIFVLYLGFFPNDVYVPLVGNLPILDWTRASVSPFFAS